MHKKNPFTLLILLTWIGLLTPSASAQGEAMVTPETAVPQEEIPVESGQIKVPVRNPFVPRFPFTVEEKASDVQPIGPIEDMTQAIVERTIEYVEPKITGTPTLLVTGLIWNSERPQAIVNGNIIEVGDRLFKVPTDNRETIPELKFVDISKDGLAVAYEDKIVIIKPELPKE